MTIYPPSRFLFLLEADTGIAKGWFLSFLLFLFSTCCHVLNHADFHKSLCQAQISCNLLIIIFICLTLRPLKGHTANYSLANILLLCTSVLLIWFLFSHSWWKLYHLWLLFLIPSAINQCLVDSMSKLTLRFLFSSSIFSAIFLTWTPSSHNDVFDYRHLSASPHILQIIFSNIFLQSYLFPS